MHIQVSGGAEPLLGSKALSNRAIAEEVERLLSRRGFQTGADSTEYQVKVSYRTREKEEIGIIQFDAYSLSSVSASEVSSYSLSVAIASAVNTTTLRSADISKSYSYVHAVSVEITTS